MFQSAYKSKRMPTRRVVGALSSGSSEYSLSVFSRSGRCERAGGGGSCMSPYAAFTIELPRVVKDEQARKTGQCVRDHSQPMSERTFFVGFGSAGGS